jgi:hypothetical protein
MATVSWGAPTLEFMKLSSSVKVPPAGSWSGQAGYFQIKGDILLENSSQLNTNEGETKSLRNEKGEDVDRKQMPASYQFQTSVIKKKGETVVSTNLAPVNGVVAGDWAMRLIPEDPETTGFLFRKCSISTNKGWSADQGALDNLNVNGLVPDSTAGDSEICKDYVHSAGSGSN